MCSRKAQCPFDQSHFSGVQNNSQQNYWNSDEMSSFGALPPLDIEPLPSLFPFSPCGNGSYKYGIFLALPFRPATAIESETF